MLTYFTLFTLHVLMQCKHIDSQKNTMSLHYVQSEPLTSSLVRRWNEGKVFYSPFTMEFQLVMRSATLSFKAMHCCECCCHQGNGTKQFERQVVWNGQQDLMSSSLRLSCVSIIFKSQSNCSHIITMMMMISEFGKAEKVQKHFEVF